MRKDVRLRELIRMHETRQGRVSFLFSLDHDSTGSYGIDGILGAGWAFVWELPMDFATLIPLRLVSISYLMCLGIGQSGWPG